jgi:hypothetical protein
MKKLLINRKKFINWYLGDSDDVMEFVELFGMEEELASTGSFSVTAQSMLESVIKFANYLPEKVLADDQEYELNHNDDVVVEGHDLITFDSNWVVCGYCKAEPVPEEDKEDCACPTCNGDGGYLNMVTEPVELSGASTDDLKKELESRGYFTENLWHVDDVESQLAYYNEEHPGEEKTLDHDQCLTILESAMTNEWLTEQIFQLIYNEISE